MSTAPDTDTTSLPDLLKRVFANPEFALPAEAAESLTLAACQIALTECCGGNVFYLPKVLGRKERNAAICHEFNGRNVRQLEKDYGLSKNTIYRIVRGLKEVK
jgi:Mor family transcriptional regulator